MKRVSNAGRTRWKRWNRLSLAVRARSRPSGSSIARRLRPQGKNGSLHCCLFWMGWKTRLPPATPRSTASRPGTMSGRQSSASRAACLPDSASRGVVPTDAPDPDALTSLSAWLEGLRMLRDRTWALLEGGGARVLPTVGHPFDPHLHIAVDTLDRSDIAAGTVIEERRRGYRVGDRVIRFAEVIVARSPTAHETEQDIENAQSFEEQR